MFSQEITRADVMAAVAAVELSEEIQRLPQGFATQLAAESTLLSTGQRRRLLLARALCRRPRLLLLDEVTANLDPETEDRIVMALIAFPAAKVFVTHSERLLSRVDRAYRVTDGQLTAIPIGNSRWVA